MWKVENLSVRNDSVKLAKDVYLLLEKNIKFKNNFWLKDQIQRSVVSIASNIAEWNDRWTDAEFLRFLYIARWSCVELKTQIIISKEIWYIEKNSFDTIIINIEKVNKMLNWLINKLKVTWK